MITRLLRRSIGLTKVPHAWFEPDHPLIKSDNDYNDFTKHFEKLAKKERERGKGKEDDSNANLSYMEHNASSERMYEVKREDFMKNQELIAMYLKRYANLNPELIIQDAEEIEAIKFDTRLQQLEPFDTNYLYHEMEKLEEADARYIFSRFSLPGFKRLLDVVLTKAPLFGIMVPMAEYDKLAKINVEVATKIYSFNYGDGITFDDKERSLYRSMLLQQSATQDWLDSRPYPMINEAENNFVTGMINWPGTEDQEYTTLYRPYYRDFHITDDTYDFNEKTPFLGRIARSLWLRTIYYNPTKEGSIYGHKIIERLIKYLSCPEFKYAFDLPGSFLSRNNIFYIHIWLVNERLNNICNGIVEDLSHISVFKQIISSQARKRVRSAKTLIRMIQSMISTFEKVAKIETKKNIGRVAIADQNKKRINNLSEKFMEQVTRLFHDHFVINQKSVDGLEELMQKTFFPGSPKSINKPFVHQIGEYVIKHREYLSTLSINDICLCNIDWNIDRIDKEAVRKKIELLKPEEATIKETEFNKEELGIIHNLEEFLPEPKKRSEEPDIKPKRKFDDKYRPIKS
ncbi:unnamed protein product [Blepharisma stoltei]|uniref:Uncharacterized protein n=1 Tax=Blepharisma stoltei TaxID=1481888 RepID=A0AAU9IZA6_9CILI|nr:unnamed protein product [Blepharisma stoltei]